MSKDLYCLKHNNIVMENVNVILTNRDSVKIKDVDKGLLLNQWSRRNWLKNPHKIPIIADHIVTAFESPYEISYKKGRINNFKNNKVTLRNTEIDKPPYSLHTEVDEKSIKIFDLTGDEELNSNRRQVIKEWSKQQWLSAPFTGRVIFASIITSYKKPEQYIKSVSSGIDNNYIKIG